MAKKEVEVLPFSCMGMCGRREKEEARSKEALRPVLLCLFLFSPLLPPCSKAGRRQESCFLGERKRHGTNVAHSVMSAVGGGFILVVVRGLDGCVEVPGREKGEWRNCFFKLKAKPRYPETQVLH